MHVQRPVNPRKRAGLELSLGLTEASEVPPKKRKIIHPSGPQPPAEFWDNLTEIPLINGALKEVDRRNTQEQQQGRTTRRCVEDWRKDQELARTVEDILFDCTPKALRDLRLFARHGGPGLSDLRGVRVLEYFVDMADNIA